MGTALGVWVNPKANPHGSPWRLHTELCLHRAVPCCFTFLHDCICALVQGHHTLLPLVWFFLVQMLVYVTHASNQFPWARVLC